MRKLIASNIMSLDGFFAGPNGELDWFIVDEEFTAHSNAMLHSVETLIFGRKTFELMAAYWPKEPPDDAVAERMNALPKLVFSNTLASVEWHSTTLVRGDAATELARLKRQPGGSMLILGSAALASSLLEKMLIDEYRVILAPIILGQGRPLFVNIAERVRLKLARSERFGSGVVALYYERGE